MIYIEKESFGSRKTLKTFCTFLPLFYPFYDHANFYFALLKMTKIPYCENMDIKKRGKKGYEKYQKFLGHKMDTKDHFHPWNILSRCSENFTCAYCCSVMFFRTFSKDSLKTLNLHKRKNDF